LAYFARITTCTDVTSSVDVFRPAEPTEHATPNWPTS